MESGSMALIRNIRSVKSARVGGNKGAKENTARQCIHNKKHKEFEHRNKVLGILEVVWK